jgi:hypothetical protein
MFPERAHACATGVERIPPPVKKTELRTNVPKSATVSSLFITFRLGVKNF